MSLTNRILGNTVMQVGGKFAGTFFGILTVMVMTRHLGLEGYGQFTTATSFLQFFGVLADFGLTLTLMRMIARPGADETGLSGNVFGLRLLSAVACFGGAALLGLAFPYPPIVKLSIAVGSLSFLFMSLTSVLGGVFQKRLATARFALAEVFGRLLLFMGVLLVGWLGYGLLAVILMLVLGNALQFAMSWVFLRRLVPVRPLFEMSVWREIVSESWPIGVTTALNLVYLKGDVIVLSLFRSQSEIGVYGAAYKVLDVITVIPVVFMGLVMPVLAAAWSSGDRSLFSRRLDRSFGFMTMLALPLAAGAWAVSDDLMVLVAGTDFVRSGPILAILMVGAAMVFWGGLFGHAIVSLGLQRKIIWAYAADAAVSFALYFALVPDYGNVAAAWVTVFSEAFIAVATAAMVLGRSRARLSLSLPAKSFLASGLMYAALLALPDFHVLLRVLSGTVVYFGLLFLMGGLKREMLVGVLGRPISP
ncbi:flippase [Candidatus Uhrbacteria bacterium]|nr:flippase [Candidatus Uhrbacteria bacterium]